MAKRIKLQDRTGVQLLPLTRSELVQVSQISGLDLLNEKTWQAATVQDVLEKLSAYVSTVNQAEGTNLAAIQALQQKLQSFEQAQDSVKNYVNAQDTTYLALAYTQSAADAATAQTNSYAEAASKATAAETAAKNYADGKFLSKVKLNDSFLTVASDETNGRYVDLGSIATSDSLQSLTEKVNAIETAYVAKDNEIVSSYTQADTAIITAYEAADAAIVSSYTAADSAIISSYTAADTALSNRITALEGDDVTMTETSGTGNILKVYTLYHGEQTTANKIGEINIPKDMVAVSGQLVNQDGQGNSGTFIELTISNGDPFYINVASLIEYNSVDSTAEVTLSQDANHQITATIGKIAASKIVYREADTANNVTEETVAQAISRIEGELGNGGSVATQIQTAIQALDADLDATGTPQHSGTFVVSGVTEVDGVITAVDSVEVEAAGAAAAAKATIDAYKVNNKAISSNPVLDGRDINVDDSQSTKETVAAAITRLTNADGNSVKSVNGQTPTSGAVTVNANQIDTVNTYKIGSDSTAAVHKVDEVLAAAVLYVEEGGTYGDTTI